MAHPSRSRFVSSFYNLYYLYYYFLFRSLSNHIRKKVTGFYFIVIFALYLDFTQCEISYWDDLTMAHLRKFAGSKVEISSEFKYEINANHLFADMAGK